MVCFNLCRYNGNSLQVSNDFYHDNVDLPVYSYHSLRHDTQKIVNTLLDSDLKDDRICKVQLLQVEHNC